MEETVLIENLTKSDEAAFVTLFESYKSRIYNTLLSLVHDEKDAEDLTQDVFVEIYESIGKFQSRAKLSTWIYRIAVSKGLDFIRRKKRKKRFAFVTSLFGESGEIAHDSANFEHPGILSENKELSKILFKAISDLKESQKVAFTLHKIEGLSYSDVSEIMGITLSSVESLIFRAKKNLRAILADYYKEFR